MTQRRSLGSFVVAAIVTITLAGRAPTAAWATAEICEVSVAVQEAGEPRQDGDGPGMRGRRLLVPGVIEGKQEWSSLRRWSF